MGRAKIENDMQRDRKIIEQLTMLSLTCEGNENYDEVERFKAKCNESGDGEE